jgi:hypothetical protein
MSPEGSVTYWLTQLQAGEGYEDRLKRGGAAARAEAGDVVLGREATREFAAQAAEEWRRLLGC